MLNDPRIWGTHLKRREVVMIEKIITHILIITHCSKSCILCKCSVMFIGHAMNLELFITVVIHVVILMNKVCNNINSTAMLEQGCVSRSVFIRKEKF